MAPNKIDTELYIQNDLNHNYREQCSKDRHEIHHRCQYRCPINRQTKQKNIVKIFIKKKKKTSPSDTQDRSWMIEKKSPETWNRRGIIWISPKEKPGIRFSRVFVERASEGTRNEHGAIALQTRKREEGETL